MKVILTRDVATVGKQGDVVTVADGYARNYLFPRNLAAKADKGALKALDVRVALEKHKGEKHLTTAQSIAEKLHNSTIVIEGKAAKGSTKLYGAITHQDVADAIHDQLKMEVDKRRIMLESPIKSLGIYKVPIRMHSQVAADVRLVVIGEGEEVPLLEPIESPVPEPVAAPPVEMAPAEPVVEAAPEATLLEPVVEAEPEAAVPEAEVEEPLAEAEPVQAADTIEEPAAEEPAEEEQPAE